MSAEPTTPEGTLRPQSLKLEGPTGPPTKPAAPPKAPRRSHAEATDRTIDILLDTLDKERQDRNAAVGKLVADLAAEREKREVAVNAEQAKYDALAVTANDRSVTVGRLETENRGLSREVARNKLVDVLSAALTCVGGGMVSYATDQTIKDIGFVLLILGVGFLVLNAAAGLIAGLFTR